MDCLFCDLERDLIIENDYAVAVYDTYPVSVGQPRLGVLHSSGSKNHTEAGQILSGVRGTISFHNLRGPIAASGGCPDFSGGAYPQEPTFSWSAFLVGSVSW